MRALRIRGLAIWLNSKHHSQKTRKEESQLTVGTKAAGSFALAIVASCLLPAAIRAADAPDKIGAAVDHAFRPLLKEYDVPGIAVAVTVDGRQHFFGYGVAAKDRNTPVTKDTLFEIGSISKTFTATLLSYAQTLGKISLDDHPGKHMPQLRRRAINAASLVNLATYTTGGLPLQFPAAVTNNAKMTTYFQQWKPSASPGAQRRYSNPSIVLLGQVTALAMNGDFADLIETELFPKLGLSHSYIRVPAAEINNYAWGYKADKPIRVKPGVFGAEAYGVKSTAADMIRYLESNIRPETLAAPMRRAVDGTHIGYFKIGEMTQGLGWEQYPYPITLDRLLAGNSVTMSREANAATRLTPPRTPSGPTLFNKTGSTNGFGAYVAFVPEKKIGIVMLANKNFPIPARITAAHAVLEQLSSELP
jgi:beta-lactamase class C